MFRNLHDTASNIRGWRLWALAPCVAALVGCGAGVTGPQLHPIAGRVELSGGSITPLAGSLIEVAQSANRTVRGFGRIQADGSFRLESLQQGEVREGVPAGSYLVRILPAEDDDGVELKSAVQATPRRYLSFETTNLSIDAPAEDYVKLTLTGP